MGTFDSYTKTEINALLDAKADVTDIPSNVSDLTNDAGYIENGTSDPISFSGNIAVSADGLLQVFNFVILSSVSVSANNYTSGTYTITTSNVPNEWTPIAIAGFNTDSRYAHPYDVRLAAENSRTLRYGVYNDRSSATTFSMRVYVLCVRTSL